MNINLSDVYPGSIQAKRQLWQDRREDLLVMLNEAIRGDQRRRVRRCLNQLARANELLRLYNALSALGAALASEQHEGSGFVVSSLFLYHCFGELTADHKEQLFFITGPQVSGQSVMAERVVFAHEKRTPGGVTGDIRDTHRVLIELERYGHRLTAHFHSHPGYGPAATTPSPIDEKFQGRLECGGHRAVAGIFSRDGWIRFFRLSGEVTIEVYGEGVKRHEAGLFELTDLSVLNRHED